MINNLLPWEIGQETKKEKETKFTIPSLVLGEFIVVKLAPPKTTNSVRDGLVSTFLMRSFKEIETGKEYETIKINGDEKNPTIEFPYGKSGLIATKFRGPRSFMRWIRPDTKASYEIPKETYTADFARKDLTVAIPEFPNLTEIEQDALIDEYLYDRFTTYGLSLDLALPVKDGEITPISVGLTTQLYRTYSPPEGDSRWPTIIVTKWLKGQPPLTGEHRMIDEAIALKVYEEYLKRDSNSQFDPRLLDKENEDEDVI